MDNLNKDDVLFSFVLLEFSSTWRGFANFW